MVLTVFIFPVLCSEDCPTPSETAPRGLAASSGGLELLIKSDLTELILLREKEEVCCCLIVNNRVPDWFLAVTLEPGVDSANSQIRCHSFNTRFGFFNTPFLKSRDCPNLSNLTYFSGHNVT